MHAFFRLIHDSYASTSFRSDNHLAATQATTCPRRPLHLRVPKTAEKIGTGEAMTEMSGIPLEGTARLRVSKIDHPMSFRDQLLRVGGVAVFLQVAGRGHGKNSRVQQSSGDKSGWARLAEANSQIVSRGTVRTHLRKTKISDRSNILIF
jgi:hypothetical protein